jgi:hypothetical protein
MSFAFTGHLPASQTPKLVVDQRQQLVNLPAAAVIGKATDAYLMAAAGFARRSGYPASVLREGQIAFIQDGAEEVLRLGAQGNPLEERRSKSLAGQIAGALG